MSDEHRPSDTGETPERREPAASLSGPGPHEQAAAPDAPATEPCPAHAPQSGAAPEPSATELSPRPAEPASDATPLPADVEADAAARDAVDPGGAVDSPGAGGGDVEEHADEARAGEDAGSSAEPPPDVPLEVGSSVRGTIVATTDESVTVQLPGARTGTAQKVDLADELGKIASNVGDTLEFSVIAIDEDGTLRLKRRASRRKQALARLQEKHDARQPVEGRIAAAIKGGFEVRIDGLRAFCPASQLSLRKDDTPENPVGQTFEFMVTKFDAAGRSLVVSRRKLLEKEQRKLAGDTRSRIAPGQRLPGRVISLQDYGAFVDLGGVHGLLHVSEISHSRIGRASEALTVGDEIEVLVLRHDPGFKKVSLSMKALIEDPWTAFAPTAKTGLVMQGRVRRINELGAFVEVSPGIEGLVHADDFDGWSPEDGQELNVQVTEVDGRRHRLSLQRAPESAAPGDVVEPPPLAAGSKVRGVVERIAPFGVFVRVAPGRTGLLHATETDTAPGTDFATAFPVGSRLEVEVVEISEDGERIRLTRRSALQRAAARSVAARPALDGAPERGERPPDRGRPSERDRHRGREHGRERGDRDRSDGPEGRGRGRRPDRGRERGGATANPAAAPSSGFASLGDVLRKQLEDLGEE